MTKHKSVYHRRTGKYIARLALVLGVFQLIAVLGSWIFKAVNPELPIRSLLSAEGIRWMVGSIGDNLAGRGLVWLLLGSMAFGSVKFCGILDVPRKWKAMSFWDHFGLMVALAELLVIVVLTLLLTVLPHAVLLGVTGNLYPSSFSKSLFFIVCLSVCLISVSFGVVSSRLRSLEEVCDCLVAGISYTLPLWLIYVLAIELYASLQFIFVLSY
ncbi:hypothetical protein [Hoylesella loescheii]|jgi:hypothetical protein|uniref:hypothetical protein n=1 Tax=Hoylesella loescheii TaxID=840 RepID=UPI0026F1BBD1|nr:hypothetical protein [Hoylesella loescheii]